jgi:hypothetical protein
MVENVRATLALHHLIDALAEHRRRRVRLAEEIHVTWRGPAADRHRAAYLERQEIALRMTGDLTVLADRLEVDRALTR